MLSGQYNLYAPTVIGNTLWVGGWKTPGQTEDAIYVSHYNDEHWSAPTLVLSKPGWSFNDPTVIVPPSTEGVDRSGWLYMYYTALPGSCKRDPSVCMHTNNIVGFASSVDGGKHWKNHGVIIQKNNGMNNCGAWAPSAVVDDGQIHLYFHAAIIDCPTNRLNNIYRYTLDATGWQIVDRQHTTMPVPSAIFVNVDVAKTNDGKYTMLANSIGGTDILQKVYRFVSNDGVVFNVPKDNPSNAPIISSPNRYLLTPHLSIGGGANQEELTIWYGTTPDLSNLSASTEVHKRTLTP